jgi:hypothetical protein
MASALNPVQPPVGADGVEPIRHYRAAGDVSDWPTPRSPQRDNDAWVSRKVAANGVVCVGYQQVSVRNNFAGSPCDVLFTGHLLQFWVGNQLLTTVARTSNRPIRKKARRRHRPAVLDSRNRVSRINRNRSVKQEPTAHSPQPHPF